MAEMVTWTLTATEAEVVVAVLNTIEVLRPLARRMFKELREQTRDAEKPPTNG